MHYFTNLTSPDMGQALCLTREGRVIEATALLQRLSRDKPAAGVSPGAKEDRTPPQAGEQEISARVLNRPGAMAANPTSEGLRGLLGRLKQPGNLPGWSPSQTPAPMAKGAYFVAATYSGDAGSRPFKLYIPSHYRGEPKPLIVMLHGCTQSPDDFAVGTRMNELAEEGVFLVAYPAQPTSANARKCWNWFNPGDQGRDRGEPALIAGITRQVMRDYAVDPACVYVAGLSAGGAAAAIMGVAYPDLYAAIGVHSGLPCGAATDIPSAFAAMRKGGATARRQFNAQSPTGMQNRIVPTIVFHADRDTTVHPINGDHVMAQAAASDRSGLHSTIERGQVPGGHGYSRTICVDAAGRPVLEQWVIHGGGHAWSGGSSNGSYTDPRGPDASRVMLRFFFDHPHPRTGSG